MAPLKPVKKDVTDKRLQHVKNAAEKYHAFLKDRVDLPSAMETELEELIKRYFPIASSAALVREAHDLDRFGSEIWNAATNLLRDGEGQHAKRKSIARTIIILRVFAFLLLDASHQSLSGRRKDPDQRIRTFKVGLKACRFSLDGKECDLALKVLERISEYVSLTGEDSPIVRIASTEDPGYANHQRILSRLVCEYYLLRVTHSWKSTRFDMAEHFFAKLNARELAASGALAEKAADLFHEAAKSLSAGQVPDQAVTWCCRALDALGECDHEELSPDVPELRLAITSTLVNALLGLGGATSLDRASSLVDELESAHGMMNRIVVALMRFRVITACDPVDIRLLDEVLARLVRLGVLTDKTFKIFMQTVHKAKRFSTASALHALKQLISLRLLPALPTGQQQDEVATERLEKAVITYVLFATSSSEDPPTTTISALQVLLDEILNCGETTLTARATHAAQTLIWKTAGAAGLGVADRWIKLLRHPVFDAAGHVNKAKIGRKAMMIALSSNDLNAAREAFFEMPPARQNEPITRYLAFKLALRSDDYDLALNCLDVIGRHASTDSTFLYACVLEAQQSGTRSLAVAALQSLVDQQPVGVHLPSLLRCTARLMIAELENLQRSMDEVMEVIIKLFERASSNMKAFRQGTDQQWRAEIQWWSKNAFNLALKWCADMHPEHLTRLLNVCTKFLDCLPSDDGPMHEDDVLRRRLLCHFLAATALVVLARANEDDTEYRLQCYLQARQQIAAYMNLANHKRISAARAAADTHKDISARAFELLKFDLECVLKLQQWDHLDQAVQTFLDFEGTDRWDSLADLVIVVYDQAGAGSVPSEAIRRIPELLQKCINETWKRDKDIAKMSRWLRITFTIHLNDENSDFALKIVQQAAAVAQRGQDGQAEKYPSTELQWLASNAFNKAVDALQSDQPDTANQWIDAALELARYADDNGSLHANLTFRKKAVEARTKGSGV